MAQPTKTELARDDQFLIEGLFEEGAI